MIWGEQDKFPLPQVSIVQPFCKWCQESSFKKKKKSSLQSASDESSCRALGDGALGYTEPHLKGKHINSIIFRFPTDFPVSVQGCLSCYSPAETETRTTEQYGRAADKNEYGDIFLEDMPWWCYHIPVFMSFNCLIRINLTREVSCPVYWGLWLWFQPCSPHSRNSLTAITAYLHLQHIGLLHEWCSQCYESVAPEKGKVIRQKIMILGSTDDLFKHYLASDILFMPIISCEPKPNESTMDEPYRSVMNVWWKKDARKFRNKICHLNKLQKVRFCLPFCDLDICIVQSKRNHKKNRCLWS